MVAKFCVVLCLWALGFTVCAETIEEKYEYNRRVQAAEAIAPLGTAIFGDQTDFYSGTTSFSVVDIDLPGNNSLPVRVARSLSAVPLDGPSSPGLLGEWELDVPHLKAVHPTGSKWKVDTSSQYNRCSSPASSSQLERRPHRPAMAPFKAMSTGAVLACTSFWVRAIKVSYTEPPPTQRRRPMASPTRG